MKYPKLLILFAVIFLSGCGITQFPAYQPGSSVQPGKVLVITKLDLRPGVKQEPLGKNTYIAGAPKEDEAIIFTSPVADKPVDKEALFPFDLTGACQMNVSYAHPSVVQMDPGVRFVRLGDFTISITSDWVYSANGRVARTPKTRCLRLYGDLKLDIPADAKAVYIGTLRYEHDGAKSTKVTVVDDYKKTMAELNKMELGISSKDVKKRLAKVIREN